MALNAVSLKRLQGVNISLVNVIKDAASGPSPYSFQVAEGLRTKARQAMLVKAKLSQTMNSRHLVGEAVDLVIIVGGKAIWNWDAYTKLNDYIQKVAARHEVRVTWGGMFSTLKDGDHWQLELPPTLPKTQEV